MGRKPGSKNKAKSAPSAAGSVTVEHNVAASAETMDDDQKHQLMLRHAEEYEKALALKKKYHKEFQDCCKQIKQEGSSAKKVVAFIDLDSPEGAAKAKEEIETIVMLARWRNVDVGTQFTLFRDDGEGENSASFLAGKEVGLAGGTAKVPSQWDTNLWLAGHAAGQAVNIAGIKQQKQRDADEFDAAAPTADREPADSE